MSQAPGAIRILRQVVAPVGATYVVVVAVLLAYRRDRRRGSTPAAGRLRFAPVHGRAEWAALARYVAATAAGGYVVFLLVVVTFYFVLGGEDRRFLLQAFREGSVLAFALVVPALLLISWVHGKASRLRQRARRSPPVTRPSGRADPPGGRSSPA